MADDESVTEWLGQLRAGDADAVQKLWERYFSRLATLAHIRLRTLPRVPADGEDVALSALHTLFSGVAQGRFADLADRSALWRMLATVTLRKARQVLRDEQRQKRGGGQVVLEGTLATPSDSGTASLDQVAGPDVAPDLIVEMAEECRRLLEKLNDEELKTIALWKMEGMTSEEIASRLGKALSTVQRRLRLIRTIWSEERMEDV